jgi:hypothetical protein
MEYAETALTRSLMKKRKNLRRSEMRRMEEKLGSG